MFLLSQLFIWIHLKKLFSKSFKVTNTCGESINKPTILGNTIRPLNKSAMSQTRSTSNKEPSNINNKTKTL